MVSRAAPIRTCIGCRHRGLASEFLRVVAGEYAAEPPDGESPAAVFSVVPDPARRLPGRGAHLHPRPECLAMAVKRRAFARALRRDGVPDTSSLARYTDGGFLPPRTARMTHR